MVEIVFTTNQQYKVTLSQLGGAILFELDYDAPKQTADDLAVNRIIKKFREN